MPELSGHYHTGQPLLLIKLQRQAVRIVEKSKALVGGRIDAYRFARHAVRFQMLNCAIQVIDAEGKMTQAAGFRAGRTRRWKRKREQLNHILPV